MMIAPDDAAVALDTAVAYRAVGLPRAWLHRGYRPAAVARPRPAPPLALNPIERQGVLGLLHTRFIDEAPAQVQGPYLCSPAPDVTLPRRRAQNHGAAQSRTADPPLVVR